jgi:nitrogen regulatory protein P-II 1
MGESTIGPARGDVRPCNPRAWYADLGYMRSTVCGLVNDPKAVIQVKLITAVLKPGQFDEVVQAAIGGGAQGLTAAEVRGFGQQHQPPMEPIVPCGRDSLLVPKLRVDIVVADDAAASVVEAIANAINTGGIGGGEIWVSAVESVLRVRTGERDRNAV